MRTKLLVAVGLLCCVVLCCVAATQAVAAETPHIVFVQEYIRQLGELEGFRTAAKVDLKQKNANANALTDGIHWSTRTQIALRSNIDMLKGMHLDPPNEGLIPQIADINLMKIELHGQMIAAATEFMSGPKPGVDYGKIAAEIPKLRAELEALDNIFEPVGYSCR
jgi:hypothetical protein